MCEWVCACIPKNAYLFTHFWWIFGPLLAHITLIVLSDYLQLHNEEFYLKVTYKCVIFIFHSFLYNLIESRATALL